MRSQVQFLAETKHYVFLPIYSTMVDRVTWYLLLVGGDRYPVKLVEHKHVRTPRLFKKEVLAMAQKNHDNLKLEPTSSFEGLKDANIDGKALSRFEAKFFLLN